MTIMVSHRPNHDPEPWAYHPASKSGAGPFGTPDRMATRWDKAMGYFPRPEFDQTRDPEPWQVYCSGAAAFRSDVYKARFTNGFGEIVVREWAPRHDEYDPPVNPILEAFRKGEIGRDAEQALGWLKGFTDETTEEEWGGFTPEQVEHARKVLTKLSALTMIGEIDK